MVGTGEEEETSWSLVRVSEMSWKEGGHFQDLTHGRDMTTFTFGKSLWKDVWEGWVGSWGAEGLEAGRPGRRPRLMFDGVNYQVP